MESGGKKEKEKKKCLCVVFWLTRRSRFRGGKKCVLGHPIAKRYCLLPDTHSDYGPPKMRLKLAV